jgi:transcriptional regulator with XRE-family HTH domain
MTTDGLRAYLRALRQARKISLPTLADAIGLSRRALIDWEMGKTEELKSGPLLRAISFLDASLEHVRYLVTSEAGVAEGKALAKEQFNVKQPSTAPLIEEVEALARKLAADPQRLSQWLGYGQRLLEEHDAAADGARRSSQAPH